MGLPGCERARLHSVLLVVVVCSVVISFVAMCFVVHWRRTGSWNKLSGSSPGTRQSSDLEKGPSTPDEDISLESVRNSAPLAPGGPGGAELLQGANSSLATPGEPGEQTRILEATRTTRPSRAIRLR